MTKHKKNPTSMKIRSTGSERCRAISDLNIISNYNIIKEEIQPLDLLLFRGSDGISKVIRTLEKIHLGNGDFSHVGFVVNSEILPAITQLIPGRLYVCESTMSISLGGITDGVPDVETGKGKFGVQIRDLEEVIRKYTASKGAKVAWAKLRDNPWCRQQLDTDKNYTERRNILIKQVDNIHRTYGYKTYELNLIALLGALFPFFRPLRNAIDYIIVSGERIVVSKHHRKHFKLIASSSDESEILIPGSIIKKKGSSRGGAFLFCSELVALVYQKLGLIDNSFNPSDAVPVDFLGYDKDGIIRLVDDPVLISIESHLPSTY